MVVTKDVIVSLEVTVPGLDTLRYTVSQVGRTTTANIVTMMTTDSVALDIDGVEVVLSHEEVYPWVVGV